MNRTVTLIALFFMLLTSTAARSVTISFDVSFTEPQAHYADIRMNLGGISTEYVDIKMPVWTPGSYLIREFAKNVENVQAVSTSGQPVRVEKVSKNTWRVYAKKSDFALNYRVYSFEISVRTPFVDASHAFLSPAGLFMYPSGMISQPSTVTVHLPAMWKKISTGLEPVAGKENTFYAPDFDILYDSPIEIGNQDVFSFPVGGVNYEVAMYGGGNYDKQRLAVDMPKIIAQEAAVFGENPNKRYVFIVHNYNVGSGGLEHLNSTVLGVARFNYGTEAGHLAFLRLVAHEHFHLWNVKRLRPKALGPFDYETENYTTNLWIAEGFTSFYDKLSVHRAGLFSAEKYLEAVLGDIGTIENQPGNKVQAASESSFDAWIKYYRPNENTKNSTVSYYNKGAVIALLMNLEILHSTRGQKSLDDVMKAVYTEYYQKQKRGYTDAEFRAMAEKIAGVSLSEIYDGYVNGTAPIDYNRYFGYAGLKLITDDAAKQNPLLGTTTAVKDGKTMITNVARGSAAWIDGLNVNDEVIAIDGIRINPVNVEAPRLTEVDKYVATRKVGARIQVLIARDGLMQTISVTLKEDPTLRFKIAGMDQLTVEQAAVRAKWIKP